MDVKKEFLKIMSEQKEIALAASCLAYLTPHALQKREWQEWGTMDSLPQ